MVHHRLRHGGPISPTQPSGPARRKKIGEYGSLIDALVPRLVRASILVGSRQSQYRSRTGTSGRQAPRGVDVNCLNWNSCAEGFAVHDTNPDRIVLGVQDDSTRAEVAVRELYAPLLAAGVPFLVTDLQTAELVKVSANAFLATKISFINAISEVRGGGCRR